MSTVRATHPTETPITAEIAADFADWAAQPFDEAESCDCPIHGFQRGTTDCPRC